MNALGPDPDPIGIRTVAGSRVKFTVTVNGPRNRIRVRVRITVSERLRDPNQCIRGQAKNFFLTYALAPPLLAISYFLAFFLLPLYFRVKE